MSAAEAFRNRLAKNWRHIARWARRAGVDCFRVYDCDVPQFPLVVDCYQTERGRHVHLQEVDTGWQLSEEEASAWMQAVTQAVLEVFEVPQTAVHYKRRVRQRVGGVREQQYQPSGVPGEELVVAEGRVRLLVNLAAYLDTGLFLDHRLTRTWVGEVAAGKRFLNLFAYTGAFTVHAAVGGARSSTSVDLSNTYCEWALRNLALNGVRHAAHRVVRADVLVWLGDALAQGLRFDLIVLDPPSFSNSKKMQGVLDVQRDHVWMIERAMALLAPGGDLLFSNNLRSFVLDARVAAAFDVTDITARTLPQDFRDRRAHQAFRIRTRQPAP